MRRSCRSDAAAELRNDLLEEIFVLQRRRGQGKDGRKGHKAEIFQVLEYF